MDSENWAEQ